MRTLPPALDGVLQDIRFGARLFLRAPWFSAVGVASLAIGLGGGIALFTAMNAVLFRPLPGRGTAGLHTIYTSNVDGGLYGGSSYVDFRTFMREAPDLFAASCAATVVRGNLTVGSSVHALDGGVFSGGCFETIGVRPHLGRLLNPSDDALAGGPLAIVISHALWRRAFAADPAVVGRESLLNGASVVIVGVTEPGFAGLSFDFGGQFWAGPPLLPVLLSPQSLTARGDRRFRIHVRLDDGVSASQAASRLSVVAAQLGAEEPIAWTESSGTARRITVARELQSRFATSPGAGEAVAAGALGAIAALIGIACVNLATMMMARGASRVQELSVRLALGASRGRLLRQLGTESLLISVAGAGAGLLIVAAALRLFEVYRPPEIPAFNVALDWRVAVFSTAIAILTPVLFGVTPGAHALRLAIAEGLKARPIAVRRGRLRVGPRELLLVAQVVVSFALLIMAALFTRSLAIGESTPQDPATARVTVVSVDLNTAAPTAAERHALVERLIQGANRVAGVESATAAAIIPMTGSFIGATGRPADRPDLTDVSLDTNIVAPGYFELAAVQLRAGRSFDVRDHARAPLVAMVSESLARSFWDTPQAVGRTVRLGDQAREVVGVVADVPYRSLSDQTHPVIYVPLAQSPRERLVLHARVRNDPEVMAALQRALHRVDPRIVLGTPMPLRQFKDRVNTGARVAKWAGTAAGVLQLGLALMATWGLVAYAVERRTTEIAIRRALGASESGILRLVMRPGLWLLATGATTGCAVGVAAARTLHSSFTGLAPLDLTIVVPAAAVLAPVVVIAAWLPARRALRHEPASALKS